LVDPLMQILAAQVEPTFSACSGSARLCKYLLNTLMQLFSKRDIGEAVSTPKLTLVISELTARMLDPATLQMTDGTNMIKALNLLMLRILDNCNRNTTFSVLLRQLAPSSSEAVRPGGCELVVRCLLRFSKGLQQNINQIDLDLLFEQIHKFFEALPPKKAAEGTSEAMVARTIKTIVHEVVRIRGPAVRDHLSRVPASVDQENNPLLLQYIELMLENVQTDWKQFGSANAKPSIQGATQSPAPQTPVPAALKSILDAIELNPDQTGLQQLQQFSSAHPEIDIMTHLDAVSPAAQGFIRGSLEAAKLHGSPAAATPGAESPAASKPSDVVKTYTSRLQALQNKYGFKSDETPELPTCTLATSAALSAAASAPIAVEAEVAEAADPAQPISTVTDAYQGRLRQLQQQYGISKSAEEEPAKAAPSNLDTLRARMQAIESNSAMPAKENVSAPVAAVEAPRSPVAAKTSSQASSIEALKARLNKVKSADS